MLKIYRNGALIAVQNFAYDNQNNQLPIVEDRKYDVTSGSSLEGEFIGNDPDGSIFWYEVISNPAHGNLRQFGGRKRRFIYTPDEGFLGQDSVVFYSIDDENARGDNGRYYFEVVDYPVITERLNYNPVYYDM